MLNLYGIRLPAHFCGVFGIRPTEQSVSGICHIEEITPTGFDFNQALEVWGHIQGFELSPFLPGLIKNTPLRKILPYFYWRYFFDNSPVSTSLAPGMGMDALGYFQALTKRDYLIATMDKFLSDWDIWLCPVSPTPAFTHRRKSTPFEIEGKTVPYSLAIAMYNNTVF